MEFRNLKRQYEILKSDIDKGIQKVCADSNFISGAQVGELESELADYVGVKHCITCANGTDALSLVFMAWDLMAKDAVFVPDFTFFATAETVAHKGATPIFVDVDERTFNMDPISLRKAIDAVIAKGELTPKAVVAVDLFGQCANYDAVCAVAREYGLLVLADSAQGFGGSINGKRAGSFGDAATTSFFPSKPLGCYGDGGAVFTNDDDLAALIKSYAVHGKGSYKYDNIRIGINSRLDTIQAAVLQVKLKAFSDCELADVNLAAQYYTRQLKDVVRTPAVPDGYYSSWAQYTLTMESSEQREQLSEALRKKNIPTMVYYPKAMSGQTAFRALKNPINCPVAEKLCQVVLSIPIYPYMTTEEQDTVIAAIKAFFGR